MTMCQKWLKLMGFGACVAMKAWLQPVKTILLALM